MNDDKFDVPMLALKDFDEMLAPCSLVFDTVWMKLLAIMCVMRTRLCVRLGTVPAKPYAVHSHSHLTDSPPSDEVDDHASPDEVALPGNMDNNETFDIGLPSD